MTNNGFIQICIIAPASVQMLLQTKTDEYCE